MPIVQVGYRRLYDAMGCSIEEQGEHRITFPLDGVFVEAYLGPRPRFGIAYYQDSDVRYVVHEEFSGVLELATAFIITS